MRVSNEPQSKQPTRRGCGAQRPALCYTRVRHTHLARSQVEASRHDRRSRPPLTCVPMRVTQERVYSVSLDAEGGRMLLGGRDARVALYSLCKKSGAANTEAEGGSYNSLEATAEAQSAVRCCCVSIVSLSYLSRLSHTPFGLRARLPRSRACAVVPVQSCLWSCCVRVCLPRITHASCSSPGAQDLCTRM